VDKTTRNQWIWRGGMNKKILIVDDSDPLRSSLRRLLSHNPDWSICGEAANGQEALEKAKECRPDLILVDFAMPVMNGLEVASELKHVLPTVPIVMLTLFKDRFLEEEAYKAGVTWVLSKDDEMSRVMDFARILLRPETSPGAHWVFSANTK
jgi:DNA-binding NarL/FixJ family response regulator